MKTVLTSKELASQLRISPSQLSRLAAAGKIPGARDLGTGANHKWRFTEEIVDRWLMEEKRAARNGSFPRRRKATPVQRSIRVVSQTAEILDETGNTHGTEYPVEK